MTQTITGEITETSTALIAAPSPPERSLSVFGFSTPEETIEFATRLANVLRDVIQKQNLFNRINGKDCPNIEAWLTLGGLAGITPRERDVRDLGGKGYEAYVDLIDRYGVVVGGMSSVCMRSEKRWANADEYAVRSMAITRATGKAFSLKFRWLMNIAGYDGTPAEEMPNAEARYEHGTAACRDWLKPRLVTAQLPHDKWNDFGAFFDGRIMSDASFDTALYYFNQPRA